ncbi:MAG: hypothetical protein JNM27_13790 [Leptospirales bacterium]|nr:hypothetical protein [Leptospirales bacterium]
MPPEELTPEERNLDPYFHIDPGFINYRRAFAFLSAPMREFYNKHKNPSDDRPQKVYNDHLLVDLFLKSGRDSKAPSIGQLLSTSDIQKGRLFCSVELIEGNESVYEENIRVKIPIATPFNSDIPVYLEFSTRHFVADTGRLEMSRNDQVAIIGEVRHVSEAGIELAPVIMGAPTFDHELNKDIPEHLELAWHGYDWFETFVGDIDQFSRIRETSIPETSEWGPYMKDLPEKQVKENFAKLLGEYSRLDWAGELADHFSASVSISGKSSTASLIFKGPADFRPMTPDMLGKRADQIYRMSTTPARILIVQHCHQVEEAVRSTLRAFAVTPHTPRRYCVIDGPTTYRLFKAYDLI